MSNVGGTGKSNIELCDLKLEQGRHGHETNRIKVLIIMNKQHVGICTYTSKIQIIM